MKTQRILITKWLERHETTAEHLARDAGLSPSSLYRFLNGDTDDMKLGTARAIAHATGYELDVCDILGIPPRYIYVQVTNSTEDSQSCEHQDWSYMVDAHMRRINTPSSRIHTSKELKKKNKQKKKSDPELQKTCLGLLEYWASVFNRDASRVKLSTKRVNAVKAALADGTTAEELRHVFDGHSTNDWRFEDPTHNEFATLLRVENIEAGLARYAQHGLAKASPVDTSWVHEQMAKGD